MNSVDESISVRDRLLKERHALLDLSTRNRLLNVPLRTRNVRTIEIVDEKPDEVYRLLSDGKSFAFLPGRQLDASERAGLDESDIETGGIPQPADDETIDDRGIARRHTDLRLQTKLTSEGLQKRLFDVWVDARTLEEEQGVNILYLALGLLRWYESDSSDIARHAPLVLLPVRLERTSVADKFKLKGRDEPASPNLSLQAKMKVEFSILIEDFADEDSIDLPTYFEKISKLVSTQNRWAVLSDAMILGFFSFSKFLMYRDLDPDTWPTERPLDHHPLINSILRDGFPESPGILADNDDHSNIDTLIPPSTQSHVVDADSSQSVVVHESANGRSLVVKGPPGTGKSQTITNIIAAAAANGKKVLFVAEKMAALEVVHRRLKQQAGLGALILELHSNKTNKKAVLEELRRTRDLQSNPPSDAATVVTKLTQARDLLNSHARSLNEKMKPSELSAQQILGHLVRVNGAKTTSINGLTDPQTWSPVDVEDRTALLTEISERIASLGSPQTHPWRGVERDALAPDELNDLERRVVSLIDILKNARESAAVASLELGVTVNSQSDLTIALGWLDAAIKLPPGDRSALHHEAWAADPSALSVLIAAGSRAGRSRAAAHTIFIETAWAENFGPIREAIATKGRSLFRFLDGNYKSKLSLLRSYLHAPLPKSSGERIRIIDLMIEAQSDRHALSAIQDAGKAFGKDWRGEDSDWLALDARVKWRSTCGTFPSSYFSRLARSDAERISHAHAALKDSVPLLTSELKKLFDFLQLDMRRAFRIEEDSDISLDDLAERLEQWSKNREQVTRWIGFAERGREAARLGLGSLINAIKDGHLAPDQISETFDCAYYEALRSEIFSKIPELRKFDGELQSRIVTQFQKLDRTQIETTRQKIAHQHATARPQGGAGIGPIGRLNEEISKKRNLLPIRRLLEVAGPAIQQLKPVFMMSPLSIAQFLKPGTLSFDLLVIDEASQIEPVDALGAIARSRQIVVVGDERQLPPTRFFSKLTGDDTERDEDDPTFQMKDAESILELCLAKGLPYRLLNWHYRSKHQSLIAVSNRQFYENRLFIVPSPYDVIAGMGLKFHHLPNAVYDRGNTRTNSTEARAVADAIMKHARERPKQSLGIATFSTAQRQIILKELELRRRDARELEEFFNTDGEEPFFVKNLENVQGDERDVIFISVGYGKDSSGYMMMNFGPLSADGGERRLNVLISRAKLRCEVFSSITGDDIDLERARSRGVAAFKLFLTFAQTGKFGLGEVSGRSHDSIFEEQVAQRLSSLGYDVKTQIGAAGFFIDLAVADSEKPGRFVLGIECDGAQYHSARSARDRDRLRQQVLEAHGWIIHRVWSTDWYLRPDEEEKKIENAIREAKAIWKERDQEGAQLEKAAPLNFTIESSDEDLTTITVHVDNSGLAGKSSAQPYQEASFVVKTAIEPHLTPLSEMVGYVINIVEIEGPIHEDEIISRIRTLWGLGRAGSRIRNAVTKALKAAMSSGRISDGPFFMQPNTQVRIRDRAAVESLGLRKPENLPPIEIEAALLSIVDQHLGGSRDELVQATSRLMGFSATSAQLRDVLTGSIDHLLQLKVLEDQGGWLVRPKMNA